ncbi:lipid-A-disaccharide synthase [Blochmannia endosymbiont of Polyrhachis (Hedomyrma) turneri]|uniref:lipid-A-disaccharide synthase n=1 Tax=Blochmannia endosymbiont of Polyrhachis (Hedomyrma) turneri TaxID=1505596 RepID=UPI00061A84A4|nr:lipid-A-disaccharide synthase [Blochmannia endosymbiont of Polyrhachis (Hedomyrma) turneri]AKC59853.1 Lipid-A-disaccharide synthase [Blochmannia endosymbiont of Polyrhachis (Hedomyrma) turneri]
MNVTNRQINIGIVAGEISGDILGAGLMMSLQQYLPNVQFFGVAGPNMKIAGIETWYDMEELTIMGIMEIITELPKILKIRKQLIRRFLLLKPNVFIGIDAPDFNITLEKKLKDKGIYTIHYVSPTIWAWRKYRIFKIANATNNILTLLPFEKKIYEHFNVPCQFIGHTLADSIPLKPDKYAARRILGISNHSLCLALLPGSRNHEVKRLINDFINCVKILQRDYFPELEIIIPMAHEKLNKYFVNIHSKIKNIHILNNQSQLAMTAADATLLASGTATLECMLVKCPMVVAYRIHPITFLLIKKFIKTPWISLPNILAKRELVKEFIQNNCCPDNLVQALIPLLTNTKTQLILKNDFLKLHKTIKCNANKKAAIAVLQLIRSSLTLTKK